MQAIIENQILPPLEVYSYYKKSEKIIIEHFDNYNKRTFRNRFFILSSTGRHLVSIPLKKGKNNKIPFRDVQISYDSDWVDVLIKTLRNCYGSSPYFEHYYDDIISIFNNKIKSLFQLNTQLREFTLEVLDMDVNIEYSTEYRKEYDKNTILDLRDKILPSAKNIYQNGELPKYPQIFEDKIGYIENPSILDLIFNMGKYGIDFL